SPASASTSKAGPRTPSLWLSPPRFPSMWPKTYWAKSAANSFSRLPFAQSPLLVCHAFADRLQDIEIMQNHRESMLTCKAGMLSRGSRLAHDFANKPRKHGTQDPFVIWATKPQDPLSLIGKKLPTSFPQAPSPPPPLPPVAPGK